MRVPFNDVFNVSPNGAVTPKVSVKVGGVTMGSGVSFGQGVSFSGIDLASNIHHYHLCNVAIVAMHLYLHKVDNE